MLSAETAEGNASGGARSWHRCPAVPAVPTLVTSPEQKRQCLLSADTQASLPESTSPEIEHLCRETAHSSHLELLSSPRHNKGPCPWSLCLASAPGDWEGGKRNKQQEELGETYSTAPHETPLGLS